MPHRFRFRAAKVARLVALAAVLLCVGVLLLLGWRRAMLATSELKQLPVYPGAMSVSFGTRAGCISSIEDMASVSSFADLTFDTTDEPDKVVAFYVRELTKRGWNCSVSEGYRASIEPLAECGKSGNRLPQYKLFSWQEPRSAAQGFGLSASQVSRRVSIYEQERASGSESKRIALFYSYFRFRR